MCMLVPHNKICIQDSFITFRATKLHHMLYFAIKRYSNYVENKLDGMCQIAQVERTVLTSGAVTAAQEVPS